MAGAEEVEDYGEGVGRAALCPIPPPRLAAVVGLSCCWPIPLLLLAAAAADRHCRQPPLLLQAREDAVQTVLQDAFAQLVAMSQDKAAYKRLLADLLAQVRVSCWATASRRRLLCVCLPGLGRHVFCTMGRWRH